MKIYQLYRQQKLDLSGQAAWDFFSSPYYLNEITPAFFNIEITSKVPSKIYAGLLIRYRMRAIWGIPMTWLSEVSQCDEPHRFVYQQAVGPFKFWSHEVCLTETGDGILLEDVVFYAMCWGWLGECLNMLLIRDKLTQIFNTRRDYLQTKWGVAENRVS